MTGQKKISALLAVLTGLGGFVAGVSLRPVSAQSAPPAVNVSTVRHPRIQEALHHLQQAQTNLQNATDNFGGYRAAALNLTQQAIAQCETLLADGK